MDNLKQSIKHNFIYKDDYLFREDLEEAKHFIRNSRDKLL